MEYITIQQSKPFEAKTHSHNSTLGIEREGIRILGVIPHGAYISLDKENREKLINALQGKGE